MNKLTVVIDRHAEELSIQEILELYGRKVIIAKDEEEVIKILKRENVGVVIMEPLMTTSILMFGSFEVNKEHIHIGGVGLVLFKIIQQFNVPIILHTSVNKKDLQDVGFPKEMIYYQKPFPVEDLVSTINNLN
jgi:CheY-like chemotaxis protein